jgi:hypothetical protein
MVSELDPYPDRDQWPVYWRAIRTAVVWLLTAIVVVGGGITILEPADDLTGLAARFGIGLVAVTVSTWLARLVNDRWDRRRGAA